MSEMRDVVIVGSGPAGYTAAGTGAAAALDAERYLAARGAAGSEPATAAVPV
jgi:thioredoxin reductase